MLTKIDDIKEVGTVELDSRLRQVNLKGFPDVRIYEDADIEIKTFTPQQVRGAVFTPQPTIYRKGFLDRIDVLAGMFQKKGIDIFKLTCGYDYTAFDEQGQATPWTLIPPVVEMIPVLVNKGKLDYSLHVGPEVRKAMDQFGHKLNSQVAELDFPEYNLLSGLGTVSIPNICDGSHRVHSALEQNISQNLLVINGIKPGFPYYAAPQPYSVVHVEPERLQQGSQDKVHVLTEPGHKLLYRVFPSGNILSGVVRPEKAQ